MCGSRSKFESPAYVSQGFPPTSATMVSHRSTKGASKARRDHINHEIRNMRALLPISQEDQERLSYLHSMAAICTYIRKSVLFQGLPAGESSRCFLPYEAFLQALHGFILVTSAQGRLVYVSENVEQYLGISMVDVLQGDTLYDMVESSDVAVVKSNLDTENNSSSERSFVCCMQTTKAFKMQHGSCCSMMVNGSFRYFPQPCTFSSSDRPHDQPLFVALCTPTVNRVPSNDSHLCQSFNSVHRLDMSFIQLSDRVLYFLGYGAEEMTGRSWYSLVHPEDLPSSADCHRSLLQADEGFQVEMVLRLQCKDLSWNWMYIQATKDCGCQTLSCTNFPISETEARYLRQKVSSDAYRPSSLLSSCSFSAQQACHAQNISGAKCFKRQRASNSQSEELIGSRARRESERDSSQRGGSPAASGDSHALFTPPYSPASSSSPLQAEELSHELLMDVHGYTERLLSSPESSPSYYTRPQAGLACHPSPSNSLPAPPHRTFEPAAFVALGTHSPPLSSSPAYEFQACPSDARLVPDSLSMSHLSEMPVDCALHQDDVSLLQQPQGGSPVQVQHVPFGVLVPTHTSLPTPNQSPTHSESDHYSEIEQAEISILAQQISSLASSFSTYHATTCDWPPHPRLPPPKPELVLDDGVFDSILTELDLVARKGSLPGQGAAAYSHQQLEQETLALASDLPRELLPAEQFTVMEALSLQLERHDQTTGLHQLNFYTQSEPQQDGFAEESLY